MDVCCYVTGPEEEVDLRSSLLETNGAAATDLAKHEPLSKRDSYANFFFFFLTCTCILHL